MAKFLYTFLSERDQVDGFDSTSQDQFHQSEHPECSTIEHGLYPATTYYLSLLEIQTGDNV